MCGALGVEERLGGRVLARTGEVGRKVVYVRGGVEEEGEGGMSRAEARRSGDGEVGVGGKLPVLLPNRVVIAREGEE